MVGVPVEESRAGELPLEGLRSRHQLELTLGCDRAAKTILQSRYMAYPLSVSPLFRREADGVDPAREQRAYLYRMNTSPGLLAGDVLGMSVKLNAGSALHLMDQAATKVHQMPSGDRATVLYEIEVGDRATLEFLAEPLILFSNATLEQTTKIILHPTAGLIWGEIILPGRLARGESYQFREFFSRIQLRSYGGSVWFVEAMKLFGQSNRFAKNNLFADEPILGTLLLVLPEENATRESLDRLARQIEALSSKNNSVELASSVLPGDRGLFVRAITSTTRDLQSCFKSAVNCVRKLRQQPPLPYSL
ncbi:MAG: urease accessory protein UreD [Phormidesmis sp.]